MVQLTANILFLANLGQTEILLLLGVTCLPMIFFILNLQGVLRTLRPENQKIAPALLWVTLIPFIGLIGQIYVVIKMSESVRLEFEKRNMTVKDEKSSLLMGIGYCTLLLLSSAPGVGIICLYFGLYLWVSYWIKISDYKKLLK